MCVCGGGSKSLIGVDLEREMEAGRVFSPKDFHYKMGQYLEGYPRQVFKYVLFQR